MGYGHHLLLIDDEPVGRVENVGEGLFELFVNRLDLLLLVLAQGVVDVRVHAHRTRAVQREDCRDVLEVVGLHEAKKGPHRTAVELEHPEGVAAGEQLVRCPVVEVELLEDEGLTAVGFDVVERIVDDREVAKPQEVHLDQAERLTRRVVELRDDLAVLLTAHDRDDVDERFARHDDTGCVHTPLALQVLEAHRRVEDRLGFLVGLDESAKLPRLLVAGVILVEHVGQRHVLAHDRRRHGLGEALAHAEGESEHATGILQGLLRLDRAVRHDLRHPVVAVLLGDVLDDFTAATVIEVDIEVGHRDAVGIEEPLEDEAVLQGVEVGDAHGIGSHRTRARSTARADADAVALCPVDEVGDDEEVAREPHLHDDADLVFGLLADLVGDPRRVPLLEAGLDLFDEPALLGLAVGHGEAGHVVGAGVELDLTALGDQQRVVTGVGMLPKNLAHLGRRTDVVAVAVELEPLRVIQRRARLHAEQGCMTVRVMLVCVVRVVGREERNIEVFRDPQQVGHHPTLDVETVIHDLGEVVLFAEDVLELRGGRARRIVLAQAQPGLHLAGGASGGRDQALRVGLQKLPVHAGLEVVPLHRGLR